MVTLICYSWLYVFIHSLKPLCLNAILKKVFLLLLLLQSYDDLVGPEYCYPYTPAAPPPEVCNLHLHLVISHLIYVPYVFTYAHLLKNAG